MQGCGKVCESKEEKGENGSSPVPAERRVPRRGGPRPASIDRLQRNPTRGEVALKRRSWHVVWQACLVKDRSQLAWSRTDATRPALSVLL